MSLIIDPNRTEDYIAIPIYYSIITGKYNSKKIKIYKDEEAKVLLDDQEKKKDIKILNTTWLQFNWDELQKIRLLCNNVDQQTGRQEFNYIKFRDILIQTCLKDWDYIEHGNKIPINPNIIKSIRPEIVNDMLNKFEAVTSLSEDEEKK